MKEKQENMVSAQNDKVEEQKKPKKKKNITYGIYPEERNQPLYQKSGHYLQGLTDEEVEERIEHLQVNIDGKIQSPFEKNLKMILSVIWKNTFTFFNILYIIVLILLLVAMKWNNPELTDQRFAITDFMFLVIVSINLIIGIVQETKSKLAINKLRLVTNPKVTVIRNGVKVSKLDTDVVLDDVVFLTPGSQIISDAILLDGEVEVNESQLTGESIPIKKHVGDMIYSGSFMVSGTSYAKVVHVGRLNEINKLT